MAFQFIDLNSSLVVAVNCDNQRVKAKNETQRGLKKKKANDNIFGKKQLQNGN